MTTQDILFYVGLGLLGLGVLLLGIAIYLFVSRNVRDLMADLNGTKRAEALEAMAQENRRRSRRRGRGGETGALNTTGDLGTGEVAPSSPAAAASSSNESEQPVEVEPDNGTSTTTVMTDGADATTVLEPDAADATTLLVDGGGQGGQSPMAHPAEASHWGLSPLATDTATEESVPDSFHIVRKIVLTESAEFIVPGQGETHA